MRPDATSATVSDPNVTGLLTLGAAVQTQPKQPLHAMRMITFVNGAAMLTLAVFYTIPRMLCLKRPSPQTEVRSYQAWVVQPLLASCVPLCRACGACTSTDLLALSPFLAYSMTALITMQDGPDAKVSTGEIVSGVLTMGISVSVLAAGTIIGSQFTSAFLVCASTCSCLQTHAGIPAKRLCWTQVLLVFMCAPLFVSPLAYLVLRAPLSPLLIPTIAATLLGAGKP